MWSSLILLLLAFSPSHAQELSCGKGVISKVTFGQKQIQKVSLCYNEERGVLTSLSCAKKSCELFKKPERFSFEDIYSQFGNPGFEVCRRLNGVPEIVTVEVNGQSFPSDRCVFPDGEFADAGSVFQFYVRH